MVKKKAGKSLLKIIKDFKSLLNESIISKSSAEIES